MTTTTNEADLTALAALATTVATNHDELQSAIAAEHAAQAELLDHVIERVRPALRALASTIVRESAETGGRNGSNPVHQREYFDERGLVLAGKYTRIADETGNEGAFGGARLYLLSDGRLAITKREGTWSMWQGSWDRYTVTMEVVTSLQAMQHFELDEALGTLTQALHAQIEGKAPARAKAARERAERAAAITKLLL